MVVGPAYAMYTHKYMHYIGIGNGGGGGGGGPPPPPPPPPPAPTTRAIQYLLHYPWQLVHHMKFMNKCSYCLSYCLLLTEYQSEILACLQATAPIVQKWVWFESNVGMVKNSHTLHAQPYILPPQPVASSYACALELSNWATSFKLCWSLFQIISETGCSWSATQHMNEWWCRHSDVIK